MSKREREGFLWILLAAAGFAFIPTIVKTVYSNSNFEPLDLALWRFIVAVPLMWLLVKIKDRSRELGGGRSINVRHTLIMGVIFAIAVISAFFALQRLPASTYIVLFYTYPALVVVFSMLLGEVIRPRAWLALALAMIGVGLTVPDFATPGAGDLLGVALALGNSAIVAVYYLMARRVLTGVEDVSRASAYIMIGTLMILLLFVPARGLQLPQNAATVFGIIAIATLGTVLPVFATNLAIQRIGPARASLAGTVEPVLSMIVAMLLLGEVILGVQWLGATLIVISVIILQLRPRNKVNINIAHEAG